MGLVVKAIIRKPERMEGLIFKKLMEHFPASFAKSFDPVTSKRVGYTDPFEQGIKSSGLDKSFNGAILDIGTGTGFAAFKMAGLFPQSQIVGLDQADQMLRVARGKNEKNEIMNVSFIQGSADNIPFNESSYDLITVSNAPFNLNEITRVLKQGGYFLFSLSLAGSAIVDNKDGIKELLAKNGLELIIIKQVQDGAFVLSMLK